jgi:hypothetical protein
MSGEEGILSCPVCNKQLDASTPVGHRAKPKPGDGSVCIYCATILVFDSVDPNSFHSMTEEEEKTYFDRETLARLERARKIILSGSY